MRLVTFESEQQRPAVGVVHDDSVVDVSAAATDMIELIRGGDAALNRVREVAEGSKRIFELTDVRLLPPLTPQRNVFCVGRNYLGHVREGDRAHQRESVLPTQPVWFTKATTSVCGPFDDIELDASLSEMYDWEAELAVVVGAGGRRIAKDQAMAHIHSISVLNDVTARDIQHGYADQWFKGKSLDNSSPTGPWLLTLDEPVDVQDMRVLCRVNGNVKQDANTKMLIFDIATLISDISSTITLLPGDIIATGTPEGVGSSRNPREFLRPGDVLETEIVGLGSLRNMCVAQ